ncbi:MAG: efflux RND transporter periplasmic adaptor subunit [Candidatus Nealsonbacteria bacterium]
MIKKKVLISIITIIIVVFIVFQFFLKEEEEKLSLFEVVRGEVIEEVFETGQVQMGENINLNFKNSGTVQRIYVEVGDKIEVGTILIGLDTSQLYIELDEAEAVFAATEAELQKLLDGATPEEIQVAETTVSNAEIDLENEKQEAEEDLNQAYEDALNTLDASYEKGYGSFTTVYSIQTTYFWKNDQESITVKDKMNAMKNYLTEIREKIDEAKADSTKEKIDEAISNSKGLLKNIYEALIVIRNMTEAVNYKDIVSSTQKANIDTEKTNVNTALTNVTNAQQTISSTRITNQININTAEGVLKKAQDDLTLKKAGPTQANINLYQAKVDQAESKIRLIENKIWESTLRSPVKGQVVKINKRLGETVQSALSDAVVILIPDNPYEIKVDIYEEDIVKMEVGDPVEISLIPLPNQIFKGKIISINPAEKLVESIVYYEVKINFENYPEGIKPGMTADLTIKTNSKENILVVPEDAIQKKDGKYTVQVFINNRSEEREVEIGMEGTNDMVEIISGLAEGEQVILK